MTGARRSRRALDGEVVGDDGKFSNGRRYPGDPRGRGSEVWNCRCTTVASMPGTDALKGRNAKGLETSYEDWKAGRDPKSSGRTLKEFMATPAAERAARRAGVGTGQLRDRIVARLKAEGREGRDFALMTRAKQQALRRAVELTRRQDGRRRDVRVVNDALYNSQKNYVERHGGVVKRDAEAAAFLDRKGAGASNYGDVLMLRPDASTSEVLEEVFHFKQHQRGDYFDMPTDEMITRRKIDAQKYLLGVAKRYNIPSSETELTKRKLIDYEANLRKILECRKSYHGGDRVNPD